MIKEPPLAFSKGQLMIYAFSLVGFFCSTVNGYDGSLVSFENSAHPLRTRLIQSLDQPPIPEPLVG